MVNAYQLRKYIHPSTRDMAFAKASNSLSIMVFRAARRRVKIAKVPVLDARRKVKEFCA
jgi:hypothetical protein